VERSGSGVCDEGGHGGLLVRMRPVCGALDGANSR
jgi:hypothetical protein